MERDLERMSQTEHDVLIVGGGINGTAVARDAALRGMQVALVEKEDFGWGTTARSTRLAHGGLRYLEYFDFGLVREGLREREILIRTAPHLVRPLPFLTPVYKGDRVGLPKLKAGMILYDLLSFEKTMPRHKFLSKQATLALEPHLQADGLKAAMKYYDGQIELPERMCVESLLQAVDAHAQVANYACMRRLLRSGQNVIGAQVEDLLTGKVYDIRAKTVVNATGPWVDEVNSSILEQYRLRMRITKGIHILVPKLAHHAIVLLAQSDGRLFFAIPWQNYTLVGTTDTDYKENLDEVVATRDEVNYLITETKRVFPGMPTNEVYYTTAGVRPLVRANKGSEGATSRKHHILDHKQEGAPGLISVLGGKITNQRAVGEDTVDIVARYLGKSVKSSTRNMPFYGASTGTLEVMERTILSKYRGHCGLSEEQIRNLVHTYGTHAADLIKLAESDATLAEPLAPGALQIRAQVVYAVQTEMAQTTADVLLRRTGAGLAPDQAQTAAPQVAELIGQLTGKESAAIRQDIDNYLHLVDMMSTGIEKKRVDLAQ